jgi:hypothetical protein
VPQGYTTKLTITERGYVKNVYLRFADKFLLGQSSTISQYENDVVKAIS